MKDAMREEFEAEYPPPENTTFNGDVYIAPLPAEGMTAYNVRWDAWKRAWQDCAARMVPDRKMMPKLFMAEYHEAKGWNACVDAMLAAAPEPKK